MTELEKLEAIRDNIYAELATITASPKVSYSIDGQSVSWSERFSSLMNALETLNTLILAASPYELQTVVF